MRGDYNSADVHDAFNEMYNVVFLMENDVSGLMSMGSDAARKGYLRACRAAIAEVRQAAGKLEAALRREEAEWRLPS